MTAVSADRSTRWRRRNRAGLLLSAVAWAILGGCDARTPTSPAPAGFAAIRSAGLWRLYKVHLPQPAPAGRFPLVIALHGATDSALHFERTTGWDTIADREGFAVVYPEGRGHLWNAAPAFEQWIPGVDDVAFISDLIDTLEARLPVDPGRVLLTGHSTGGHMVYRLAHELAGKITAIGPVGTSEIAMAYSTPVRPVAIIHLHALDDSTMPIGGKPFEDTRVLPVDSTLLAWRLRQGCDPRPDTVLHNDLWLGVRWRSPDGHGDVALYLSRVGGHSWFSPLGPSGLSASELIWSFFETVPAS